MSDSKTEAVKKGSLFARFSGKKDKSQQFDDENFVLSSPTAGRKDSSESPGFLFSFFFFFVSFFFFFSLLVFGLLFLPSFRLCD